MRAMGAQRSRTEATVGAWSIMDPEEDFSIAFCFEGEEEVEGPASSSEMERCDLDSELIVETEDAALEGIPPRLPPLTPPPTVPFSIPALAVVLNAIFLLRPSDHSAVLTKALK